MSTNEKKYLATLVRGECYGIPKQTFRPDERHIVSEEVMFHLQEHAIYIRNFYDTVTGETMGEPVEMFNFEPFDGPEPAGHRFPTPEELEAAASIKASRARARRIALAKVEPARGDAEPARARSRARAAA